MARSTKPGASLGRGALLGLAALGLGGCSYALLETARTEPPGTVGGSWGFAKISNELSGEAGRVGPLLWGPQLTGRVGVTEHLDLGIGPFFGLGVHANVKYNLMERHRALAVAPRLGAGYADRHSVASAYGGVLGSYRLSRVLEPYAGITFANYWVGRYAYAEDFAVGPGERLAERTGTGDGLLQVAVGLQIPADTGLAFMVEVGRWFVMQNDPGDFYRFVPTTVIALGMRFGRAGPSREWNAPRRPPPTRARSEPEPTSPGPGSEPHGRGSSPAPATSAAPEPAPPPAPVAPAPQSRPVETLEMGAPDPDGPPRPKQTVRILRPCTGPSFVGQASRGQRLPARRVRQLGDLGRPPR